MDNKGQEKNESLEKEVVLDTNYKKVTSKNVEIIMHVNKQRNPTELLEKFYLLRNDETLSNEEKNEEVRKIMTEYMRWLILENVKHSLLLNLSNQANTIQCRRTNLSQFNYFIILGLEYLNTSNTGDSTPISFTIDSEGNLSINGLDENLISEDSIFIYTDKKVTESD